MTTVKPYFVYILWSATAHKFYTGVTENVTKRLEDHNTGISKWTKRYAGSWRVVWQQEFLSLGEARKFENQLKRQKGGAGFFRMTGLSPQDYGKPSS